jgi:hypothetical protein
MTQIIDCYYSFEVLSEIEHLLENFRDIFLKKKFPRKFCFLIHEMTLQERLLIQNAHRE